MNKHIRCLLWISLCGWIILPARAQPFPFEVTVTSPSSPGLTVKASGNQFGQLGESIIRSNGVFQPFANQTVLATFTYYGAANAIVLTRNATSTQLTFALPPLNYSRAITGTDATDLEHNVEGYFHTEGNEIMRNEFQRAISALSPVSISDGNPMSTTAQSSEEMFRSEGFTPVEDLVQPGTFTVRPQFKGLGLGFNTGTFEAAGFEGTILDFTLTALDFRMDDGTRVVVPVSYSRMKLGDAWVTGYGAGLAMPKQLRAMGPQNPWNWRVTPSVGFNLRTSKELSSGAWLWLGGLTNTIDYQAAPHLVLCLVNQLTGYRSMSIKADGVTYDPDISQQILKNGVRMVTPLTTRVIGDVFIVDTRFLKSAAVDQFTTLGGSLSLRASPSWNVRFGANTDFGHRFKAWSIGLSSAWHW